MKKDAWQREGGGVAEWERGDCVVSFRSSASPGDPSVQRSTKSPRAPRVRSTRSFA